MMKGPLGGAQTCARNAVSGIDELLVPVVAAKCMPVKGHDETVCCCSSPNKSK